MTFGEKLYQLRKAHGLSQEALAEKLNTSRQAVSKWENNNGYPETEKILLISKLFAVDLNDLLMDDRKPEANQTQTVSNDAQGFYVSRETANGFLLYIGKQFVAYTGIHTPWSRYFAVSLFAFLGIYMLYFFATYLQFVRNIRSS